MTPFCDYLNVSVPYDSCATTLDELLPLLDELAAEKIEGDGALLGTWKTSSGTFKATRRGKVAVISASGQLLVSLRGRQIYDQYLRGLACGPHRVTLLHATLDVWEDAPPTIDKLYQKALAGEVALTRKQIKPQKVKRYWGPGRDGRETGTVYLGNRANADVWAKVYDKREEQISKGFPDPGPTTRYEVCIHGDGGPSLRDAQDPTAIFYHFASPGLLEKPEGIPAWSSAAEGYAIPPKVVSPAAGRLKALVEGNGAFDRAVKLALEIGDEGMKYLGSLLAAKARTLEAVAAEKVAA